MISRSRRWFDEELPSTPWLLTFSDLLLLLITVFVMKLAMSSLENEGLAKGLGVTLEKRIATQQASVTLAKDLRKVLSAELGAPVVQSGTLPILEFPDEIKLKVLERGVEISLGGGRFLPGRRELSPETLELLALLAPRLSAQRTLVRVEGHTDSTPISTVEFASNWELSSARAIAVAEALMEYGLEGSRISTVGYADTRPVATNSSEYGRALNRRVELLLEPRF